jgi:hypothetical protein
MPRVPSQFVPQVGLQDGALPPVQPAEVVPMRSFAGEQQQQMGQSMERLGNVTWRIGQIIEDEMNESRIKEAEVQLGSAAMNILRGQNGYLTTEGKLAENAFMPAADALDNEATKIRDGLDNDMQRTMFTQLAQRNLLQWKGAMADHRNRKVREYNIEASSARANMYVDNAVQIYDLNGESSEYRQAVHTVNTEIDNIAALQGLPLNSPQAKALRQSAMTKIARGVVRRLADKKNFADAIGYIDQLVAFGNSSDPVQQRLGIKEEDVAEVRSALLSAQADQTVKEVALSVFMTGQPNTPSGTHNMVNPVEGGAMTVAEDGLSVRYSMPEGTPVRAPANVTVESVSDGNVVLVDKTGYTFRMEGVSAKDMSGRALKVGDTIQKGKLVGFAASDKDNPGYASFTYMTTFDGIPRNPTTVNQLKPATGPVSNERPKTMSEGFKIIDAAGLPVDQRQRAKEYLRYLFNQSQLEMDAKRAEVEYGLKLAVADQEAKNMQAAVQDKVVIDESWLRDKLGDDAPYFDAEMRDSVLGATETSYNARLLFESGQMTRTALNELRGKISNTDFAAYHKAVNDPKYQKVTIDQGMFDVVLADAKLEKYIKPAAGTPVEREALRLRESAKEWLAQRQVEKGQELTPQEKKQALTDFLQYQATSKGWISRTYPRGAIAESATGNFTVTLKSDKLGTREYEVAASDYLMRLLNTHGFSATAENAIALDGIIAHLREFGETAQDKKANLMPISEGDIPLILSVMRQRDVPLTTAEAEKVYREINALRTQMNAKQAP